MLYRKLIEAVGPLAGNTFAATHVDSWEVGAQKLGPGELPAEFQRRRGYDSMPFLPVMTGRVVDNLEILRALSLGPAPNRVRNGRGKLRRRLEFIGAAAWNVSDHGSVRFESMR